MENMKATISATVDKDIADWIDQQVKNKKYRNKSHIVELALTEFKEKQQRTGKDAQC
jgi:Arc/MetJ-type ribon-helix-helix transcriptional regulator